MARTYLPSGNPIWPSPLDLLGEIVQRTSASVPPDPRPVGGGGGGGHFWDF
jgi:hypothetical protein